MTSRRAGSLLRRTSNYWQFHPCRFCKRCCTPRTFRYSHRIRLGTLIRSCSNEQRIQHCKSCNCWHPCNCHNLSDNYRTFHCSGISRQRILARKWTPIKGTLRGTQRHQLSMVQSICWRQRCMVSRTLRLNRHISHLSIQCCIENCSGIRFCRISRRFHCCSCCIHSCRPSSWYRWHRSRWSRLQCKLPAKVAFYPGRWCSWRLLRWCRSCRWLSIPCRVLRLRRILHRNRKRICLLMSN